MSWYDEVYDESKEHDIRSQDNRDVIIAALAVRLNQMEVDLYNSRMTYYAVMRNNDMLKKKIKELKNELDNVNKQYSEFKSSIVDINIKK